MNGQRFHQQKRIEMKTGQCERSLKHPLSRDISPCRLILSSTDPLFNDDLDSSPVL